MPATAPGLTVVPGPQIRMTTGLAQAISLLALPAPLLQGRLRIAAVENPALRLPPSRPPPASLQGSDPEGEAAPGASLIAHVLGQIAGMRLPARQEAIALALTDAMAPTGWLVTPLPRLARDLGLAEADLIPVLDHLHRIEPAGLFARSLAECLMLQARAEGPVSPAMAVVLADLPRIARGELAALARQSGLPEADLAKALGQIRGFDPKPGLAFAGPLPPPPPPELLIQPKGALWQITINPALGLPQALPDLPGTAAAEALCRAISGRLEIGLTLGRLLVAGQQGWLSGGTLAPLTTRALAAETGLHLATVNRALTAITARGPRGTHALRAMLAQPLGGASDDALRHRLAALLALPGPRPSDRILAERLAAEGIHIARRTLTKYRAALTLQNQPSSRHHR